MRHGYVDGPQAPRTNQRSSIADVKRNNPGRSDHPGLQR